MLDYLGIVLHHEVIETFKEEYNKLF